MKEINKTVQDMKMEIETVKKTQAVGIPEMKNKDTQPETTGRRRNWYSAQGNY